MQKNLLCSNTKTMELCEILGNPKTRKEVLAEIEKDELVSQYFKCLSEVLQEELIAFCMGNRGLKITYDPFFKFIFNPSIHPERLSELLTLIFGEEVEVVDVIPNESERVTEEGSLLITDILVRLRDGSYANVDYSDFYIIPINLLQMLFLSYFSKIYRNNLINILLLVSQ